MNWVSMVILKFYLISILFCLGNINGVYYNVFLRLVGFVCK